jgi:hypothetical protein
MFAKTRFLVDEFMQMGENFSLWFKGGSFKICVYKRGCFLSIEDCDL